MAGPSLHYDISVFIELIKCRPCLWDKCHEEHKNKRARSQAWFEIFEILAVNSDALTPEEKSECVHQLVQKWNNIRDAFVRTLRKPGQCEKRPYIYHGLLQFLVNQVNRETYKNINFVEVNADQEEYLDETLDGSSCMDSEKLLAEEEDDQSLPEKKPSMVKRKLDIIQEEDEQSPLEKKPNTHKRKLDIINEIMNKPKLPRTKDSDLSADESFFTSFVPFIRDMDESERIQLQMDILSDIRKIKQNRVMNQITFSNSR